MLGCLYLKMRWSLKTSPVTRLRSYLKEGDLGNVGMLVSKDEMESKDVFGDPTP